MEINLGKIQFDKGFGVVVFVLVSCSFVPLYIFCYDVSYFDKIDLLKLVLLSIVSGAFLVSLSTIFFSFFFVLYYWITKEWVKYSFVNNSELDTNTEIGHFTFTFCNAITLLDLLRLRFFSDQAKDCWIRESILVWSITFWFSLIIFFILTIIEFRKRVKSPAN